MAASIDASWLPNEGAEYTTVFRQMVREVIAMSALENDPHRRASLVALKSRFEVFLNELEDARAERPKVELLKSALGNRDEASGALGP